MFILNKKTKVIQECSNNDVVKACKKDAEGYDVADTMEALQDPKAAEAAQAAAKEKEEAEAAQTAAKAAEDEKAAQEAQEAAEKAAAEQQKAEDEKKAAEATQAAQDTTQSNETNADGTKESDAVDYQSMNVADLRKVAKEKGIQGYGNMNKDTLVAVIMAH